MAYYDPMQFSPSRVGIDRWIFQELLLYKKSDIILNEETAQDIIDDALEPYELVDGALAVYKYPKEKMQALIEIVNFVWELCDRDPDNVQQLLSRNVWPLMKTGQAITDIIYDVAKSTNGPVICG